MFLRWSICLNGVKQEDKMKIIGKIGIAILFLFQVTQAMAQQVEARLDSADILIGDQTGLELEVKVPAGHKVFFPNILDTVTSKIEVVNKKPIDTTFTTDSTTLSQRLTVTSFDTGYLAIPPFQFGYGQDKIEDTIESEPLLLNVNPVEVDTTQPIKSIKGPMEAPLTFAEMLPWILGSLALLLLIWAIWYIRKRKKQKKPVMQTRSKPNIAPEVEAKQALETLKQKKLWQNGKVKAYYTELTHILRVYIERKFEIPAVESTSNEILRDLESFDIEEGLYGKLKECLETSDMVKFAKMEPLPDEHERSYHTVAEFVEQTKSYGQEAEKEDDTGKLKERHVE